MSRVPSYLMLSRHSVWYFRLAVPAAIRSAVGCTEVRRSLSTRNKIEALLRGRVVLLNVQRAFTEAFQGKVPDLTNLVHRASQKTGDAGEGGVLGLSYQSDLPPKPKLSEVLKEYRTEQQRQKVGEKTLTDKEAVVRLFVRVLGDKPIDQYSRDDAKRFREIALRLPPRVGSMVGKTIRQLIADAEVTISETTFNNYIKNLTTIFTFAKREGYLSNVPFERLKIRAKGKVSKQRSRYTESDLSKLFSKSSYPRFEHARPHRYWLPLLALFTGARLNELCQLYLDDVEEVEGLPCLLIRANHPGQVIKTVASERVVPLHSQLLKLGFLGFVESQRSIGASRLFPELKLHPRQGYSKTPSRWFSSYRKGVGFSGEEKKDFHSFRHTVADHLKQQGVEEPKIAALLGHQAGGITFGRYGKDYKPEVLVEVVECLSFGVFLTDFNWLGPSDS